MMNKKLLTFIICLIILCSTVAYGIVNRPIYGNDVESITKIINSMELYKGKSNNILEVKDFGDLRVVAFLSNNDPSIIEFIKDSNGNYKNSSSKTVNEDLYSFIIHNLDDEGVVILSVRNQYSNIDNFIIDANGEEYVVNFDNNSPNVQWTKIKKSVDNHYEFELIYNNN